jgi:Ca-activated chloride channel family protein
MKVIAALAMLLLAFAARGAEESRTGELLFTETTTGRSFAAIQLRSEAHLEIAGLVARVTLKQRFRNDSEEWLEGVYVFPLPETAAVSDLQMEIGDRRISGEIHERVAARQVYERASRAGQKASLVEQQRPNMFTTRVANVGPGEEVLVQLQYVQQVRYWDGEFSVRLPMTVTPRYIPVMPLVEGMSEKHYSFAAGGGWARDTDQVPDARAISPPLNPVAATPAQPVNPIRVTAAINMGLPLAQVESVYHEIVLNRSAQQYSLQLASGTVSMDRDFLLRWQVASGQEPQVAAFREQLGGADYLMLMVLPPQRQAMEALPRELIFVIDTSGSMGGAPIQQARASLVFAVNQLRAGERFNIIEFNSSSRRLFPASVTASEHNVARAREFIRHLQAGGGTEMLPALQLALRQPDAATAGAVLLRQVVFITDGAVGNELALFKAIERDLGSSRLFTVGIGSAPNSWFMRKAAEQGRGVFTLVGDVGEVHAQMQVLFTSLSQPLVSDVELSWPSEVEYYPRRPGDLYRGEPLLIVARSDVELSGALEVGGKTAGVPWKKRIVLEGQGTQLTGAAHPGVAILWARRKIAELMDQKVMGRPDAEVRDAVLPVALAHRLVSPYTSFVAVEQRVSRLEGLAQQQHKVPNARPAGQAIQGFAYPNTATVARESLLLGAALLILAGLFWLSMRLEERYCRAPSASFKPV